MKAQQALLSHMDLFVSGSYMVEVCRKEIKRHCQIVRKKLVGLLYSAPSRLIGQLETEYIRQLALLPLCMSVSIV